MKKNINSTQRKKIIHIYNRGYSPNFPTKHSPYFYLAGWAQLQAVNILKFTNLYEQEIWRPEREVKEISVKKVEGVMCRLFPQSKKYSLLKLPLLMIKALRIEAKKNLILIDLHYIHYIQSIWLIFLFHKCPIFISHHGSVPFEYQKKKSLLKKIVFNKVFAAIDRMVLKWVDYFSVVSRFERDHLSQFIEKQKIVLESGRKFFKDWKPVEKKIARQILGIPIQKNVILYVGSFYELKGVDILLNAFDILQNEIDLELLLVGGLESDSLYEHAKRSGAKIYGKIPNDQMDNFFSSADVYCAPALDGTWVKFGGISTAIIEALACDIPVVSRQLLHFPSDDWKKVGEVPETEEDVQECIRKVLRNPRKYSPRETSKKYYDFGSIIKGNIKVYNDLFSKYYGV